MKKLFITSIPIILLLIGCLNLKSSNGNPTLSASFEFTSKKKDFPLEILGVTVVPHFISGEIPSSRRDERYNVAGSNVRIYIRNTSQDTVFPKVTFNGQSGTELLAANMVSYCDVPETRKRNNISSQIPPGAIDYYLLNLIESSFYTKGITIAFQDSVSGLTMKKKIEINKPDLYASRITFSSSTGSVIPDGFYMYFKNERGSNAIFNEVKIWSASERYTDHWWNKPIKPKNLQWFGRDNIIAHGSLNGAYVKTGNLHFGEAILEFSFTIDGKKVNIFYTMKPMVINFDLGMGWGDEYLEGSLAFVKTMKLLHMNTVNGNAREFFTNADGRSEQYPMKVFSKLIGDAQTRDTLRINQIHGEENIGEPQLHKLPAQDIYDYYSFFRQSAFPSTLTLSHEPGFNAYAGVVDFNHFDAYRVTSPHADRWGQYYKYGEKNVRWGAPLETLGDYMRTLNRISYPNRVAAWTQGMFNDWAGYGRASYPNPLEIRIQAYEVVANGASSLYWFTLGGKHLMNHRFCLPEIQKVNREFMVVGELITKTVPWSWVNRFMDMDYNVLAGPDYAILFAIDLRYGISKNNEFISSGPRTENLAFHLPEYLQNCNSAVKICHDGISQTNVKIENNKAFINDTFDTTAMYVLFDSSVSNLADTLVKRFDDLVSLEKSYRFNPITSDIDWNILINEIEKVERSKKK